MHMKKKTGFLMCLVFLLCGCASQKEVQIHQQEAVVVGQMETEVTEIEISNELTAYFVTNQEHSRIEGLDVFAGELDFDYVPETDSQIDLGDYSPTAYIKDGAFNRSRDAAGHMLWFYDYKTGTEKLLCNKEGCWHIDDSCGAVLDVEKYELPYLWYQEGFLYVPKLEDGELCIERISSTDGAVREKACTLMKIEPETVTDEDGIEHLRLYYPGIQLHRGYAYFTTGVNGEEQSCGLYRVKLDGTGETETLYTLEASGNRNPTIYHMKPYGRYVLFEMGYVEHGESSLDYSVSLYAYDTEGNGEITCFCEGVFCDYTLSEDALYYLDIEGNIYKKEFDAEEAKLFYQGEEDKKYDYGNLFFSDGKLVYEQHIPMEYLYYEWIGEWQFFISAKYWMRDTVFKLLKESGQLAQYGWRYDQDRQQFVIAPDGSVTKIRTSEIDQRIVPYL